MISVAHILPTNYMDSLSGFKKRPFHLALAHRVITDQSYASFYKDLPKATFVILDNSAFEFGKAIRDDILLKSIDLIEPDEFILPDFLFNGRETIKRSEVFLNKIKIYPKLKVMGVPQGKTTKEWIETYKWFSENNLIDTIGIGAKYCPLFYTPGSNIVSGRDFLMEELKNKDLLTTNKDYHLLGLGDSGHLELETLNRKFEVRSVDSSAAYINSMYGTEIKQNTKYTKRTEKINFSDKTNSKIVELLKKNMASLDKSKSPR